MRKNIRVAFKIHHARRSCSSFTVSFPIKGIRKKTERVIFLNSHRIVMEEIFAYRSLLSFFY